MFPLVSFLDVTDPFQVKLSRKQSEYNEIKCILRKARSRENDNPVILCCASLIATACRCSRYKVPGSFSKGLSAADLPLQGQGGLWNFLVVETELKTKIIWNRRKNEKKEILVNTTTDSLSPIPSTSKSCSTNTGGD